MRLIKTIAALMPKIPARIAVVAIVSAIACMLCSCAASPAKESASKISVDEAMGDTYQKALDAAQQKADDVKLLAIRSSSYCSDNEPSTWMYLFYSFDRAYAYTVFVSDGNAMAADSGPMSISPDEFASIPDAANITVDAPDAWKAVASALDGDSKVYTARAFLMTYIKGDDDPMQDAMKWFFSVNENDNLSAFFENSEQKQDNSAQARLFAVNCSDASVTEIDAELLATE